MKRLVCTGGGTAGHVVPTLPVMQAFVDAGVAVDFVGSGLALERSLVASLPVTYHAISAGKLRRYFSLENLLDVFRVLRGIVQSWRLIRRLHPDVVFSKGGYVSFPVVLAAWLARVPVVAHESDLSPGLANRLALPFVTSLCVSFPGTKPARFRGELLYTGTPVRPALLAGDAARGRALLGAPTGKPVLVVTGGSLGADRLNAVLREALPELIERAVVVHVCGPGKALPLSIRDYHQFEYVREEWGDLLAAADLVVSRAGANTLYELLCLHKPNILVPLPKSASRGDQIENAAYAESEGFSRVIPEAALDARTLVDAVTGALADRGQGSGRIAGFSPPDAVALIVAAIRRAAGGDAS